jgi:metal-dependent amidase/aminoacylase/carboxypeptidase family protein
MLHSVVFAFSVALASAPASSGVDNDVHKALPALLLTYQALHKAPELSQHEVETEKTLAARLRALGVVVTTGVGGP